VHIDYGSHFKLRLTSSWCSIRPALKWSCAALAISPSFKYAWGRRQYLVHLEWTLFGLAAAVRCTYCIEWPDPLFHINRAPCPCVKRLWLCVSILDNSTIHVHEFESENIPDDRALIMLMVDTRWDPLWLCRFRLPICFTRINDLETVN